MSDSVVTLWTVTRQALLSMGYPRQDYWSGLLFPSPGDLPDPGLQSASPALAGGFLTTEPPGKPKNMKYLGINPIKGVKNLCIGNYKILLRGIKDDLNK